jgi:hypothetical protein
MSERTDRERTAQRSRSAEGHESMPKVGTA